MVPYARPQNPTQRLSHYPPTPRQSPQKPRQAKPRQPGQPTDSASMMMYTNQMTSGQNAAAFGVNTGPGEKFSCPKCGKTFKEKYHFFGHMNSHLNVRPYTRKKCGKGFSYSNNLSRHKRTCGAAEVGHKCDICQQSFGSVNALQMHLLQSHDCGECTSARSQSDRCIQSKTTWLMFIHPKFVYKPKNFPKFQSFFFLKTLQNMINYQKLAIFL